MPIKNTLICLSLLLLLGACSTEPQPIHFGKDQCLYCKMTIMDSRFGAEIINSKGKMIKFDSAECLVNYLRTDSGFEPVNILVVNYLSEGDLIDAPTATYLVGGAIRSPMGGNLAAFKTPGEAINTQKSSGGELLNWDSLKLIDF